MKPRFIHPIADLYINIIMCHGHHVIGGLIWNATRKKLNSHVSIYFGARAADFFYGAAFFCSF